MYCFLCECFTYVCPRCGNSNCSSGGCGSCVKDHDMLHKKINNLTEQEQKQIKYEAKFL
jgi:hypothetical protein